MTYDYLILAGIAGLYLLISFVVTLAALYVLIITELRTARLYEFCPHCGGTGFGAHWTPCPHCGMTGYVPKERHP